jgi:hypothetical protein
MVKTDIAMARIGREKGKLEEIKKDNEEEERKHNSSDVRREKDSHRGE